MADVFVNAESLDNVAPQVQNENPGGGASDVLVTSNVYLEIVDDPGGSGVDLSSVDIEIDGTPAVTGGVQQAGFAVTINAITDGYSFDINPDTNLPFNSTVNVQVDAQDLALTPNVMPTVNYSFTTEVGDTLAPVIENESPAPGETEVARNTNIQLDIIDPPSTPIFGVDLSTVNITVNSSPAVVGGVVQAGWSGIITVQGTGYRFDLDRDTDFDLFEDVTVEVQAADNIVANALDTSYSFKVTEGLTDVSPVLTAIAGDEQVQLLWTIEDEVMIDTWQLERSESSFPSSPGDGELVFSSPSAQLYFDTDVINETEYYYTVFLIRRREGETLFYAPYDIVSSKLAKPRRIVSSVSSIGEYVPQRGEFGPVSLPLIRFTVSEAWGAFLSDGTRRLSDLLVAPTGTMVRSPVNGTVKSVQGDQVIIEARRFLFTIKGFRIESSLVDGSRLSSGQRLGRTTGSEIEFSISTKPEGSLGGKSVRPAYFFLTTERREGRRAT